MSAYQHYLSINIFSFLINIIQDNVILLRKCDSIAKYSFYDENLISLLWQTVLCGQVMSHLNYKFIKRQLQLKLRKLKVFYTFNRGLEITIFSPWLSYGMLLRSQNRFNVSTASINFTPRRRRRTTPSCRNSCFISFYFAEIQKEK